MQVSQRWEYVQEMWEYVQEIRFCNSGVSVLAVERQAKIPSNSLNSPPLNMDVTGLSETSLPIYMAPHLNWLPRWSFLPSASHSPEDGTCHVHRTASTVSTLRD
jgi:hypothetical protein